MIPSCANCKRRLLKGRTCQPECVDTPPPWEYDSTVAIGDAGWKPVKYELEPIHMGRQPKG